MATNPKLPAALEPEPSRSFTVRVPKSVYIAISNLAQAEKLHLNKKVNQLLSLGMDKHTRLDDMLLRLIKRSLPEHNDEN